MLDEVMLDQDLSPNARILYYALHTLARPGTECSASTAMLATMAGLSSHQVLVHLDTLYEKGLIARARGERGAPNRYVLKGPQGPPRFDHARAVVLDDPFSLMTTSSRG